MTKHCSNKTWWNKSFYNFEYCSSKSLLEHCSNKTWQNTVLTKLDGTNIEHCSNKTRWNKSFYNFKYCSSKSLLEHCSNKTWPNTVLTKLDGTNPFINWSIVPARGCWNTVLTRLDWIVYFMKCCARAPTWLNPALLTQKYK